MSDLIELFKGLDWLANALGVLLPVGGVVTFAWRWQKNRTGIPQSFGALVTATLNPKPIADTLKQVGRIAIVDDNISDFPVAELKRAGYNIKTYKHVNVSEFDEISNYDVVFLDMLDIVKDDPTEGGLKLIKTLRSKNPRQKICAVSSKKFDPAATAFFKLADDTQNKPMSAQKCVQVIDTFLSEKLDPKTLAGELDTTDELRSSERSQVLAQLKESTAKKQLLPINRLPQGLSMLPRSLTLDLSRVLIV